ncbi:MAG: hypothetical protein ACTSQ7_03370 [Alphaproteobacteria bacterium]
MRVVRDIEEETKGPAPLGGPPSHSRTLGRLVKGKNINQETLLATDYLNHFNEIVMLIDMVPMMPECIEDAKDWAPKSYEQHFQDSVFADKDLAILAYLNAPTQYREPFDDTVSAMNDLVAKGLTTIEASIATGEAGRIELAVSDVSRNLQSRIDRCSAIINGYTAKLDQSAVDELFD